MKSIPLKTVPIEINGQAATLDYREQLQNILRAPSNSQAGADYEEIRKSLRLLDALEQNKSVPALELEDADYEYLRLRVMGARFLFIDKAVMDFIEDVTNPK
jgi:hypothetical protein